MDVGGYRQNYEGFYEKKLHTKCDGESFQHKDTRLPSEPRYELRKITHSQYQQNSILLLIHKFDKLLTRRYREVVDFTRYRVKNYSELTNFGNLKRIERHNGK